MKNQVINFRQKVFAIIQFWSNGKPIDEFYNTVEGVKRWKFDLSEWDKEVYNYSTFDFGFLLKTYNELTVASGISLMTAR